MESALIVIFWMVALLYSVVIHEVSHGAVAYSLGDPTAKNLGRLTLNPLKHLDMFAIWKGDLKFFGQDDSLPCFSSIAMFCILN